MWIYISVTVLAMMIAGLQKKKKAQVWYSGDRIKTEQMLLSFVPIFFITIFRWNMSPDTTWSFGSYYIYYERFIAGGTISPIQYMEGLFWKPFEWLAKLGVPLWFVFVGLSIIYVYSFVWFIRRNSSSPVLSILLYTCLGFLTFPFGALKQALSETFILWAYDMLINDYEKEKRGWIKIIGVLILGGFCHNSCFFLIPIIFLAKRKYKIEKIFLITLLCVVLTPFIGEAVIRNIAMIMFSDRLANISGYGVSESFIMLAAMILLSMLPGFKKMKQFYSQNAFLVNMVFFFLIVMVWSSYLVDPYRIIYLFLPIALILVPIEVKAVPKFENRLLLVACLAVGLFIYFWNLNKDVVYEFVFPYLKEII